MRAEPGTIESRVVMVLKIHLGHVQVWEGDGVVKSARKLIGSTNPLEAEPGTIRGDLAVQTGRNVVHGSDSPENGERETGADTPSGDCVPFRCPSHELVIRLVHVGKTLLYWVQVQPNALCMQQEK